VIVNICTLDRFKGKHQPSYLVSNLVGTISIVLEMKDTKTVTPQVRADITFPFYILLYLSFWTNVMHYVFTDLLDRSLCFKSGDHHILVLPLSPRSQAFQSLSQGPEQRYSSSLHKPNKGNIQKQPHLKKSRSAPHFSCHPHRLLHHGRPGWLPASHHVFPCSGVRGPAPSD